MLLYNCSVVVGNTKKAESTNCTCTLSDWYPSMLLTAKTDLFVQS